MRLTDLRPMTNNANRHTVRGLRALDDSLRQDGYTEPMVATADGTVISGNARLERVVDVLGTDVEPIIVESDGTRPVVHVRTDISDQHQPTARRIAVRSNRVAELDLDWDIELVCTQDPDMLAGLWDPAELERAADAALKDHDSAGDTDRSSRLNSAMVIRLPVYVADVAVIEKALEATGNRNRGEALSAVCAAFLEPGSAKR